ncbi:ABC transporter transmembrane domain-containing protein [Paraconexibacter antarcticus]|uniref:ABC transporter transmembrane domain-containing protein n=1 Tax=Paraconexibacter antarcticus TaxID=2949664 RepID=A0ABY5DKM0_9ACTN|nr:ABC transporter transmembrane domain-containing protein [Paraconexibacter antarcticus]UTI62271.1 ABC transporter transmembrane domain-containing protein [Paraconexibacter antarcticus]
MNPGASTPKDRAGRGRMVIHRFRRDIRKRRGALGAGTAFAVIYALARVAEPWPLKVVFDQVLFHRPTEYNWLIRPFTVFGTTPLALLGGAALILAVLAVIRGVAYQWQDYLLSRAAQEIVYGIRTRLYRHLHRLPLSFHQSRSTGDTLMRLTSDIVLLRDVLIDSIVNLSTGIVLIILMLVVMTLVDPVLTLAAGVVMPLVIIISSFYGGRIRVNAKRQRRREGQTAAIMHEALAGMSVVQLHTAEEREQERYHDLNRRSLKQGIKGARLEAKMNRSIELALAAGTIVVLWVGTLRAIHGALTPGELIVFISYLRAAYRPLRRASKTVQRSAKALSAAERILDLLDTEPDLQDLPGAIEAPPLTGRIAFDDVHFAYRPDEPVLESITLEVQPGSSIAIVGATGSGKSTLLRMIPRLFDATAGRVTVDGHDVRDVTLHSLRRQVALVEQDSVLFGLSIAENIRYGHPDASDEEVAAAAAAAGVDEFASRLPEGYDTVVSERGASLSGGQRQRVAIARALVRECPVLLLDEPSSGLDPVTRQEVFDALTVLMHGRTTVLVTHDLRLVRDCDQIIVLDAGRVVAQGDHDTLLRDSSRFRSLAAEFEGAGRRPPGAPERRAKPRGVAGQRILFYSHNGVGLGHLQRQLDLATAFHARHPETAILMVTGSHAAGMFEYPPGIDYVKLPSLAMVDRYRTWRARDLPLAHADIMSLRAELLEETVRRFRPDLLVADFLPAGPHGELLGALAELERGGGRAVAGFRDVIDEPPFVRELWEANGTYEALHRYYAAICVYGDRSIADFATDYGLTGALADRTHYCGYLGRGAQSDIDVPLLERPFVIATSGGGADGGLLLEPFVHAAAAVRPGRGGTWMMVTGPLMDGVEHDRLAAMGAAAGITVRRVIPNLRAHVALADCLVAMPGYNTTCDLLSFRLPAVIVPRRGPSQEQALRAARLHAWGVAQAVTADAGCADHLGAAITAALDRPRPPVAPVPLDGLARAVDVFEQVLAGTLTKEDHVPTST